MIKEKAYAKVNLSLDITGRRENGYHDVKMIMQTIDLYDELEFDICDSGINLIVDNEELDREQKEGMDNLVVKAARLIMEYAGIKQGVMVKLNKNIPIAAGMAGGSSDAAATLRGLNRLFELNLSDAQLEALGVQIGADVPYCVRGGTRLCEGIGEIMSELSSFAGVNILICKPPVGVSTKEVYTRFDALNEVAHPDVDEMAEAISNNDTHKVCGLFGNVLECVTKGLYPMIGEIEDNMRNFGAVNSVMSGSGPTSFGIFDSEELCLKAERELKKIYTDCFVYATKTV